MMLDFSLFPDTCSLPENLSRDSERAEYVARVCSAWDFGITPTRETFELLGMWRDIFDRFPISGSPSYLAFRMAFGWPPADGGQVQVSRYERLDRRFRQDRDPFADCT
jgi:hypothetical protein